MMVTSLALTEIGRDPLGLLSALIAGGRGSQQKPEKSPITPEKFPRFVISHFDKKVTKKIWKVARFSRVGNTARV